jgi:N-acyl-D-aspartate/D-glutamate deacylase
MNRIIFTGGQVFDGTGGPPVPADVVVRGDRWKPCGPAGEP